MLAIANRNIKISKGIRITKGTEIEFLHLIGSKIELAQIIVDGKIEFNTTMNIVKKFFTIK